MAVSNKIVVSTKRLGKQFLRVLDFHSLTVRVDVAIQKYRKNLTPTPCLEPLEIRSETPLKDDLLVTTQTGLMLVCNGRAFRILPGRYFGLTRKNQTWHVFRVVSQFSGSLLSLVVDAGRANDVRCLYSYLHPTVHQIDATEEGLVVCETGLNRLLLFPWGKQFTSRQTIYPVGKARRGMAGYAHMNSHFTFCEQHYVVCHNDTRHTGKPSELLVLDKTWSLMQRISLNASCAHNIAFYEGVRLLCDSGNGRLLIGHRALDCGGFTRGLALADDVAYVGVSAFAPREERRRHNGHIFQINLRTLRVEGHIQLLNVGSIYEVRLASRPDMSISVEHLLAHQLQQITTMC
jgi:hypothetical protein